MKNLRKLRIYEEFQKKNVCFQIISDKNDPIYIKKLENFENFLRSYKIIQKF